MWFQIVSKSGYIVTMSWEHVVTVLAANDDENDHKHGSTNGNDSYNYDCNNNINGTNNDHDEDMRFIQHIAPILNGIKKNIQNQRDYKCKDLFSFQFPINGKYHGRYFDCKKYRKKNHLWVPNPNKKDDHEIGWWHLQRNYNFWVLQGNDGSKQYPRKIDTYFSNAQLICQDYGSKPQSKG